MNYALYFLQFDTPIHFGCGEDGGNLEQGTITYRSDTLFSALCSELAANGENAKIETLYALTDKGELQFSNLFPYIQEEEEEPYLFLPKPLLKNIENAALDLSYGKYISYLDREKQLQHTAFLRATELSDYLKYMNGKISSFSWQEEDFGQGQVITRVNQSETISRPYFVYAFTFKENAGLYGIIGYQKEEEKDWLLQIIQELGLSGIGGKRSSGYGKFHFWQDPAVYTDKIKLSALLTKKAEQYMSISMLLPDITEIETVKQGQYLLAKRSGFLTPEGLPLHKRKNVYMLEAGSCFPQKMKGRILDVSAHDPHPVWRNGKGFFVGLS